MTLMNKLYCSKGKPKPSQHFEFILQIKNPEIPGLYFVQPVKLNLILRLYKQLPAHSSVLFLIRHF
jgi:hypothetical protein